MRTKGETGAGRTTVRAPLFPDNKENDMKANSLQFVEPAGRTRQDAVASATVLGAMLLASLAGVFVVDVDPSGANAAGVPVHYAAIEEAP